MSTRSRHGFDGVSKKNGLGVGPHGLAPGVEVAAVDQRRCDAEARQQVLHHIEARAEQRLGGDHVIAGLEEAQQRRRHRRHAGRRGARGLGALEQLHALLEHGDRRVGVARIDEAAGLALEALLGLLGAVVDVALGQEQRLRGLGELRAQRAAVHQPRLGRPVGGIGTDRRLGGLSVIARAPRVRPRAGHKKSRPAASLGRSER